MISMIKKLIIKFLEGKIKETKALINMPSGIFAAYLRERFFMLLRGLFLFRKFCFIGKGIKIKCKRRVKIGIFSTLHNNVTIDASSSQGIIIGDYCAIGMNSIIRTGNLSSFDGYFIMGQNSSCNANCFLGATGGLQIGKNVLMGPNITILTETHNYDAPDILIKEQGGAKAPVVIEDNVWMGANTVILGGTTVMKGAIIGAGSIVTKNVRELEVVAGNPAKPLRNRK